MSQIKNSDLQTGSVAAVAGGGLAYLSGHVGAALATAPAGAPAPVYDVLAGPLPVGMFGVGAVVATWGVATVARRLAPRGRVRARYDNPGWADWRQVRKHLSRRSALLTAAHTRKERYGHIKPWSTWTYSRPAGWVMGSRRLTATEYAVFVGKSVTGPAYHRKLWVTHKDIVLIIAPPQTGKTAWLCGRLIDAPGAVIATSTRHDIYEYTHDLRREGDRPVLLFNPEGLGGLASTFEWDPVAGCDDPATAARRAADLVAGTKAGQGVTEGGFFETHAIKVLRALLLAAALDGQGMAKVAQWANNATTDEPEVILMQAGDKVPAGWLGEFAQVLHSSADRTRESIYLTMSLATAFMSIPSVAKACTPGAGAGFDLAGFLAARGTLYLLGEHSTIAPLLTALTSYLFEGAKKYASLQPGGRLDPPALFALDEAALISPVPLDRWVSDSGGRNISIIIAVQALSQLFHVFGQRQGETIKNNANLELYFGGLTVTDELADLSALCGEYELPAAASATPNRAGSGTTVSARRRVITIDGIRELPEHHVLVLYRHAKPIIARTVPVWERPDVKRIGKAHKGMAKMRAKAAKVPGQRDGAADAAEREETQ